MVCKGREGNKKVDYIYLSSMIKGGGHDSFVHCNNYPNHRRVYLPPVGLTPVSRFECEGSPPSLSWYCHWVDGHQRPHMSGDLKPNLEGGG